MKTLLLLLTLPLAVATAADRVPEAPPEALPALAAPHRLAPAAAAGKQACLLGNRSAAAYGVGGWVTGDESYGFVSLPQEQCAACDEGVRVTAVHLFFVFSAAQVPQTFTVRGGVSSAYWDEPVECILPGEATCLGEPYVFTVEQTGLTEIVVPVDCDWRVVGSPLLLTVELVGPVDANLAIDDHSDPCLDYNYWDGSWKDLDDHGFGPYGDVVLFADAECASLTPIGVSTWGALRRLYR